MKGKGLLTELIVSTLLFLLCTVCAASLLVHAYATSQKSHDLIEATQLARAAVTQVQQGVYPQCDSEEFRLTLCGEWQSGAYFDGTVEVYRGAERLVSLPCASFAEVEVS